MGIGSSVVERAGVKRRGFGSMDKRRQSTIASKGGKAAHEKGTAHEWTSESAREAGRIGGLRSQERRRALAEEKRREELIAQEETS
jgi:general stress protein YciG